MMDKNDIGHSIDDIETKGVHLLYFRYREVFEKILGKDGLTFYNGCIRL